MIVEVEIAVDDCHDHGLVVDAAVAALSGVHVVAEQLAGGLDMSAAMRGWSGQGTVGGVKIGGPLALSKTVELVTGPEKLHNYVFFK